MAELDPLVAEILLKGDTEFISSLKKIGEEGAESFEKLAKACETTATSAQAVTGALHLVVGSITAITAATVAFVEQQTELTQRTILLADAMGTTAGALTGIEAAFASAGVKTEQFERFANRLTITIAREWPQIAESIKNYATENDAATLRVSTSIQRVRDAQNALGDNSAERFSQMAKDGNALEAAYIKLTFAAQHAAQEQIGAAQSVRGAELSVTAAVQNLNAARGVPPSASEKQSLQIAQAQQAVDTARKAEVDARIAQQEKAANASLKQRQIEQEVDDLARKAAKNARDDAEQRVKDQNAVKEAIIARAEAEQKAEKLALTNVASVRDALDSIVKGNKDAASAVDLTKVSVKTLSDAIIAQAAETTKQKSGQPNGVELLYQLNATISKTKEYISESQRLALVNRLAGTSMQALGASAAEITHVLEDGTGKIEKYAKAAEALNNDNAKHKIEEFRGALAELNLTISLMSQRFAIAISPAFTEFLVAIRLSLTESTGTLYKFLSGLQALGGLLISGFSAIQKVVEDLGHTIDHAFDLAPGRALQVFLAGLVVAVSLFATAWIKIPILIAAVVTGIGYIADHMKDIQTWIENNRAKFVVLGAVIGGIAALFAPWAVAIGLITYAVVSLYENWDKVKAAVSRAWQSVTDNAVVSFLSSVIDKIKEAVEWWNKLRGAKEQALSKDAIQKTGRDNGAEGNPDGVRLAGGGEVHGPGSTTSDSVLARLSRGEFVVRAAAVQQYGAGLFHALNSMSMPGFATGGLVPAPVRYGGGAVSGPTSTLNLTIGDRTFNGLRGPKSTVDDLANYATSQQTTSAGSKPQWVK